MYSFVLTQVKPLGIKPQACRPNRPQTKGAVERFGRYVKENALAYLSINNAGIKDAHDLQHRLDQWIEQQADRRRTNGKSIEELFEIERSHLVHNPDISTYMNIASLNQLSSLNGEMVIFGYRITVPKKALAPELVMNLTIKSMPKPMTPW